MPFFRAHSLVLLLAALAAAGCAQDKGKRLGAPSRLQVPADEATAEERAQITATVKEIEAIAGDLARPQQFRGIPILVTSENMLETKRAGSCTFENGKGKFILVNRGVFLQEKRLAEVGFQTTLFRVILHEIGHCYLGRDHLEQKIDGRNWTIRYAAPKHPAKEHFFRGGEFVASSMESQSLLMPIVMKKYYVAELLGLFRAANITELAELSGAKLSAEDLSGADPH